MRTATACVVLCLIVGTFPAAVLAQTADAQRAGPQSQPSVMPGRSSANPTGPRLGFVPAHLKRVRPEPPRTEPTPAIRAAELESDSIIQAQAALELPPPTEMIAPSSPVAPPGGSIVPQGESVIVDSTPIDIDFDVTGETYGGSGDACCGNECGGDCFQCCVPLPRLCLPNLNKENLSFFVGVQGFKGPVNRGADGSFGFTEGFNWGTPLDLCGSHLAAQIGLRSVQSNFHGTAFTSDDRTQFYLTAGLFRRADCGLQFGGVIDFQHDDWYAQTDLAQFRGEISWLNGCASEIGFLAAGGGQGTAGTSALRNDQGALFSVTESRDTTDYYAFFYRHQLDCGAGDWRMYGGFTNNSDGLIGGDAEIAISPCWSLQSSFTYLIPQENNASGGNLDEAWNVGIQLVFHPWGGGRRTGNYARPLFNVADNGSLLVDIE